MYRIKVNAAGLRLLSLERLGCKAGPWLASGNFNEKQFPTLTKLTLNDRCASTVCTNNMVYAQSLLPFLDSEILVHARHRVPPKPDPMFPWLTTLHMCCRNSVLEE